MKTLQFLAVIAAMTLWSCSNDDGNPVVTPNISFSEVNFETSFFTEGTTEAPALEWNGEEGTLALESQVQGVSVNATDGTISWDKSLPLGLNDVKLIASNSAGSKAVTIQIENKFMGDFTGGYNSDPEVQSLSNDFELTFNADGTMTALDGGESAASGTWTLSGTTFTSTYTYEGGGTYSLVMDIIYSDIEAVIEGYWYDGDNPVEGNEQGFIKLNL